MWNDFLSKLKQPRDLGLMALCLLGLAYLGWLVSTQLGNGVSDTAYYKMYVDTENGKAFRHKVQVGDSWPLRSPYSGKDTGMPAEACFWTADGKIKSDPDWVVLNETLGKSGPTFCPICGRLVVGHNPAPHPGGKPPPTRAEYLAKQAAGQRVADR